MLAEKIRLAEQKRHKIDDDDEGDVDDDSDDDEDQEGDKIFGKLRWCDLFDLCNIMSGTLHSLHFMLTVMIVIDSVSSVLLS